MPKKKAETKPKKKAVSKPKSLPTPSLPKQEKPEAKDFTEIGGSPVPGLTLRQVLRGHTDRINRIAWSPDGKYLASPSHDKTIRIWDITSGKNIASLGENQYEVISVAWSPNSKILASGTRRGIINLWDTESWQPISTLYGGVDPTLENEASEIVSKLAWSPDGIHLAAGFPFNCVAKIWNINNQNLIQTIKSSDSSSVVDLIWSADNKLIVASCNIDIRNSSNGELIRTIEYSSQKTSNNYSYSLALLDENQLIIGKNDSTIRVCNTQTGMETRIIEGHTSKISSISLSFDKRFLISKSQDNFFLLMGFRKRSNSCKN